MKKLLSLKDANWSGLIGQTICPSMSSPNLTKALDIKATLTLEDTSSDVPNPMGNKIDICLTDAFDSDEEDK